MLKQLSIIYRVLFKKEPLLRKFSIHKNRDKRVVQFPHDESFLKDQEVQWWYWTGHLTTESGRRFGYEVVFFVFDSWIFFRDILAQVAITDEQGKKYHYREDLEAMRLPKSEKNRFALAAKTKNGNRIHASGGAEGYQLTFDLDGMTLDLNLTTQWNTAIRYGGNPHHYTYGGYTYYYSREKMETTGSITIDGKQQIVTGETWYDRQYGDLFQSIFKGWQWFSLTLFDGRTIMLYDYFDKYKNENFGSITEGNSTVEFKGDQFLVEIKDCWQSPHSDNVYPIKWDVTVAGVTYTVIPVIKDQELCAKEKIWIGPEYWEGDCYVECQGKPVGNAYVELNGFGRKLISFVDGVGI